MQLQVSDLRLSVSLRVYCDLADISHAALKSQLCNKKSTRNYATYDAPFVMKIGRIFHVSL